MNKCEELGFKHAWEDISSGMVFASNPPMYPPKTYRCKNCGLIKSMYKETHTTTVYNDNGKIWKEQYIENDVYPTPDFNKIPNKEE